jgi:hypothetical protein
MEYRAAMLEKKLSVKSLRSAWCCIGWGGGRDLHIGDIRLVVAYTCRMMWSRL